MRFIQGFVFKPATKQSKFLRFEKEDWDEVEHLFDKLLEKLSHGQGNVLDFTIMLAITLSYERDMKRKMKHIMGIVQEIMKSGVLLNVEGLLHHKLSLTRTKNTMWQIHGMATIIHLGWRLCCA